MYIIVGLGNPTRQYIGTRHNIGFEVIDLLAAEYNINVDTKKHKAFIGKGIIGSEKVILAKPQTYMNLSGESVQELLDYYKISQEEIIIIYDDISLDIGQIRIKEKGSAGGHNGIKNIISHIGSEFPRIKIGVGEKPKGWDLSDYVLAQFDKADEENVKRSIVNAKNASITIIQDNIQKAMNEYNKNKKE